MNKLINHKIIKQYPQKLMNSLFKFFLYFDLSTYRITNSDNNSTYKIFS